MRGKIALAVTGAIAAVEAPRMATLLQHLGFEVWAVTSETATRFVSVEALTAITHRPTFSTLWTGDASHPVPHIEIAEWADLVIVYPASATTLSRLSTGDCSDLVSALAIATRAPVVLAPSMNGAMLEAPSVERNLQTLRDDGFFVVLPSFGIEVADRPDARRERYGPALSAERLAELVTVLFDRIATPAIASRPSRPIPGPIDWERIYEEPTQHGWETEVLEDDLQRELSRIPPPATVVDLGAGLGTTAIEMAKLGYRVVATDVSSAALERAKLRSDGLPIVFVRDDVTRSNLHACFDLAVDRGLFHTLSSEQINLYASTLRRLVRVGGRLLLKMDSTEAPAERLTLRLPPTELPSILPGFELLSHARSSLGRGEVATGWLCVLERVS